MKITESKKDIEISLATSLTSFELVQLSEACQSVVETEDNFGWITPPTDVNAMSKFWQGVLLIPERKLFIAKLDNIIAGSIQVMSNHKNQQARKYNAGLTYAFVAPWARGYKISERLVQSCETYVKQNNFLILEVEVRESQVNACKLFEKMNYVKWGYNPKYVYIKNQWVGGCYYYKEIQ